MLISYGVLSLGTMVVVGVFYQAVKYVLEVNKEISLRKEMAHLHRKIQPRVTVLLYCDDGYGDIAASINALQKSRYSHYDIVVIDDSGGILPRSLRHEFTSSRVAWLRRHKKTSRHKALRAGYAKSQRGDVVIVVSARQFVSTNSLKMAVADSDDKRHIWRLQDVSSNDMTTVSDIAAVFFDILSLRDIDAFVYTKHAFLRSHTYKTRWLWARRVLFLIIYSLFVTLLIATIVSGAYKAFVVVWLVGVSYVLVKVWLTLNYSFSDKRLLSVSVLPMPIILPATGIIYLFSQLFRRK